MLTRGREDDNKTLRTWHPDGEGVPVEKKPGIMPHHEVLLRLDAMDLERGPFDCLSRRIVMILTMSESRCKDHRA